MNDLIRCALGCLLLTLLLAAAAPIVAAPAGQQPASGLTVELIDQRIAALKAQGVGEADETLKTYEEARQLLSRAHSFARDAASYVDALTSAPEREKAIQERLDTLDDSYEPAAEIAVLSADEGAARLALARTEAGEVRDRLESLDQRLAARESNAAALRARLAEINQLAAALPGEIPTVEPSAAPSLVESRSWRDAVEAAALNAEAKAKEAQLASQPVRFSAMAAERAELTVTLERLEGLISALELRRSEVVDAAFDPTTLGVAADDPAHLLALDLVSRDATLRAERLVIDDRLAELRALSQEVARRTQALDERYATARRIVEFAGDSEALGRVLLTYWSGIDDFVLADPTVRLSREVGGAVIRRIGHEEVLATLVSASGFVNGLLREAGLEPDAMSPATISALRELARAYRESLRSSIAAESENIETLSALDSGYAALQDRIAEYRQYLDGLVLWIPNHPPLWTITPAAIATELGYIAATASTIRMAPGLGAFLAFALALAIALQRDRLGTFQQASNGRIARPREDSVRHTVLALAAAALRVAPVPLLLLGLASVFDRSASTASRDMFDVLAVAALVLFSLSLLRIVCEPGGIGQLHFAWRPVAIDRTYRELTFLTRWWLPVVVLAALATQLTPDAGDEAIGRATMLLAILVIGYHIGASVLRDAGGAWLTDNQNRVRLVLMVVFVALLGSVVHGQVYKVQVVLVCLVNTLWAGLSLLLLHAVLMRWLLVTRRRLRFNQLLAQRAQQDSGAETAPVEEEVAGLDDVSGETRQLVNVSTLAAALAMAFAIWEPLLPAFGVLSGVNLWTSSTVIDGETVVNQITLATVVTVLLLAALTLFAARRLPALVEIVLRSRTHVTPSARYTVSTLLNYIIIGTGIVAALSALGLRWGQLQWLVAALGVGIGFGLQEIVANFISGLIILFERPIRVGDIVTVGDKDGTVTRIRIRATTIRDLDGKELLVPNKEFITQRLLNWSLSDPVTRLVVNVGVAYGSDVELAMRILREIADEHELVLEEPEPSVVFTLFGDNSLNLTLRCHIADLDVRMKVTTDLHREINNRFNAAGVVIAFPQRDVHFDASQPIRVSLEDPVAVDPAVEPRLRSSDRNI